MHALTRLVPSWLQGNGVPEAAPTVGSPTRPAPFSYCQADFPLVTPTTSASSEEKSKSVSHCD